MPRYAFSFVSSKTDVLYTLCVLYVCISDVTWWRHQMKTFCALLALCAGNSLVTGEFPSQRPVTRSFDVFFDLRLNKRLSKQSWGCWFETTSRSLWRHFNSLYHKKGTFIALRVIDLETVYRVCLYQLTHRSRIKPYLMQIMACRLFGARPLCNLKWYIINWTLRNEYPWNLNQNTIILFDEMNWTMGGHLVWISMCEESDDVHRYSNTYLIGSKYTFQRNLLFQI